MNVVNRAMPEPLLDFITGRARAALPFLRKAAAAKVSPSAAADVLRAFGAGIQTQKLLDIYAVLQQRFSVAQVLRLVPETTPIPEDLHFEPPFDVNHNFEYVVAPTFSVGNPDDYLTVVSSVPLSPASIRALGAELGTEGGESDIQAGILAPEDISIIEINKSGKPT